MYTPVVKWRKAVSLAWSSSGMGTSYSQATGNRNGD
jgi:hypothetical protein